MSAIAPDVLPAPPVRVPPPEAPKPRELRARFSSLPLRTTLLMAVHVPLGIAMHRWPLLATVHGGLTLLVSLVIAVSGSIDRIVAAAAYFCGAEVLWRMSHARTPWEFGKYSVIVLFTIAIIRQRPVRLHWPSITYALLLLPSAVLTLLGLPLKEAQGQIGFNLGGPMALAISVWLLVTVDLDARAQRRIVVALLAPMVGIMAITAYNTYVVGGVQFGTESNFAASGGFGPNQVSAILAFGVLAAFLASFDRAAGVGYRAIMFVMVLVLSIQSAMTFSRGGLIVSALSAAAALFYLMGDRGARVRLIIITITLSLGAVYVIIPALDDFTGGALSKRFGDHSLTRRDDVIKDDIDVWLAYPMMGVGPGMAKVKRIRSNNGHAPMAAHTEFSRLLAEHGLFGVAAMLMLLLICIHGWQRATTPRAKAAATAYLVWSMLFMAQSGTRIVAPSLAMGLAYGLGRGGPRRRRDASAPDWMQSSLLLQHGAEVQAERRAAAAAASNASPKPLDVPS